MYQKIYSLYRLDRGGVAYHLRGMGGPKPRGVGDADGVVGGGSF